MTKLGEPPYVDSAAFQLRATLLADAGGIEGGKKFTGVLLETLFGMIGTYGPMPATWCISTNRRPCVLSRCDPKMMPEPKGAMAHYAASAR